MLGVLERNGKEAARLEGCGRGQQVGTVSRRQPDHVSPMGLQKEAGFSMSRRTPGGSQRGRELINFIFLKNLSG